MMWGWYTGWHWWMALGGIFFVLFWAAVIFLLIWAVRRFSRNSATYEPRSALDIAKERYARGEITKEQFDQIKKDLGS